MKELLDQNRIGELERILLNRVAQAVKFMERLEKEGQSHAEAEQTAIEVILQPGGDSPELSDNPPEPLSLKDQEEVYRKLELRGDRAKDELARKYVETHDKEIIEDLYELSRELEKMEKQSES